MMINSPQKVPSYDLRLKNITNEMMVDYTNVKERFSGTGVHYSNVLKITNVLHYLLFASTPPDNLTLLSVNDSGCSGLCHR